MTISEHAIDRYIERVNPGATRDDARAAMAAIVERAQGCADFAAQIAANLRVSEKGVAAMLDESRAIVLPIAGGTVLTCFATERERCIGHRGTGWGQPCRGEPWQYCQDALGAGLRRMQYHRAAA